MPSAFAMSLSVAFSFSLTFTPPKPRVPPSVAASATLALIVRNHVLKAAASVGALASRIAETSPRALTARWLTSAWLAPASRVFSASRILVRPSEVSKSATTALISSLALGSVFSETTAFAAAKDPSSGP